MDYMNKDYLTCYCDLPISFEDHVLHNKFPSSFLIKFLNRTNEIYYKFQPPTVHGYASERFTALIMNLQEEFIEWKNSNELLEKLVKRLTKDKNENFQLVKLYDATFADEDFLYQFKETMLEVIDMICYLGTLMVSFDEKGLNYESVIHYRVFTYNEYKLPVNEINTEYVSIGHFEHYMNKCIPKNIETIYREVIDKLVLLRTNFRERKWHKPQLPDNSVINTVKIDVNRECFKAILLLLEELILMNKFYLIFVDDGRIYRAFRENLFENSKYTKEQEGYYEFEEYFRLEYDKFVTEQTFVIIFNKQQVTLDLEPVDNCNTDYSVYAESNNSTRADNGSKLELKNLSIPPSGNSSITTIETPSTNTSESIAE